MGVLNNVLVWEGRANAYRDSKSPRKVVHDNVYQWDVYDML
jgi:hypothetical protein